MLGELKGLTLDLGRVAIIAEVWLNGNYCGNLWKTPYSADISKFAKAGENTLKIEITNTWTNRLIGDALIGDDWPQRATALPDWAFNPSLERPNKALKTFSTFLFVKKTTTPADAGLLGPVCIRPYGLKIF